MVEKKISAITWMDRLFTKCLWFWKMSYFNFFLKADILDLIGKCLVKFDRFIWKGSLCYQFPQYCEVCELNFWYNNNVVPLVFYSCWSYIVRWIVKVELSQVHYLVLPDKKRQPFIIFCFWIFFCTFSKG